MNEHNVIWSELCTYNSGSGIQSHFHDFFHFIYVESGVGSMTVSGVSYIMTSGTIYPIAPKAVHTFSNSGDKPLRTIELKLAVSDASVSKELSLLPASIDTAGCPIRECLYSVYEETVRAGGASSKIRELRIELFISYLLRLGKAAGRSTENVGDSCFVSDMERVIAHINKNLALDFSLDNLADVAGFEKNYFLRKFKKYTGDTPMAFILNKRIEKAKELLRFSDMSITQVADALGFNSIHYFSNAFYKATGVRPSEYRSYIGQ